MFLINILFYHARNSYYNKDLFFIICFFLLKNYLFIRILLYKHFTLIFWLHNHFVNSQHYNTNSKGGFVLKTCVLKVRFKDFWYTKINLSQNYITHISYLSYMKLTSCSNFREMFRNRDLFRFPLNFVLLQKIISIWIRLFTYVLRARLIKSFIKLNVLRKEEYI